LRLAGKRPDLEKAWCRIVLFWQERQVARFNQLPGAKRKQADVGIRGPLESALPGLQELRFCVLHAAPDEQHFVQTDMDERPLGAVCPCPATRTYATDRKMPEPVNGGRIARSGIHHPVRTGHRRKRTFHTRGTESLGIPKGRPPSGASGECRRGDP
jgi:hypothetical protein